MSSHETGGRPADQPTKTDQPSKTETSASGDIPSPAEDPSNRESRSPIIDFGPNASSESYGRDPPKPPSPKGTYEPKELAKEAREKAAEWEEKLKVVLKK